MSTRAEHRAGRGGRRLAALGLVLAVAGVVLLARPGSPGPAGPGPLPAASLPAYVVAPAVRLERARPAPSPYAGVPVGLVVPALDIRAPVVPVRAVAGGLVPPADPQVLGWWSGSARAGALHGGTVVIGHTVHTGGGAFDHLDRLSPGDVAAVRTERGRVRYVVRAVSRYPKRTLAADARRLFDQSVPGRLLLVTCSDWDGTDYRSNTVVLADLAPGST